MFSLFKKKQDAVEVPEWASFFNGVEYSAFIKCVADYFYKKNVTYTLGDGVITAGPNDFEFDILGLTNVAQVCKQSKIGEYKSVVNNHFDTTIRINRSATEFKKLSQDYGQIEKYLAVRLYPEDYIDHGGRENKIYKEFAGDVVTVLVLDMPEAVQTITPEQLEKWGKTVESLFETGVQNIKNNYTFKISKEKFDEFYIWFVQGDHFFVPNILFYLESHKELIGTKGSLIGIPHRHAAIIYPIESVEVVGAMNTLIPVIYGMNGEGPGSVSNNLFWYKDSKFENLPYKIEEDKIQFYPPKSFIEVLNEFE